MAIAGIARPLRILLATAAIGGALSAGAFAAPPGMIPNPGAGAPPQAPVVLAQSADPQYRISQLEEQIRAMNGRIEELGFQMLQMQEQMRQFQEDNEFRFQSLEGGAPAGDRSSAEPPAPNGQPSDFSATQPQPELQPPSAPSGMQTGALPGVQQDVTASTTPSNTRASRDGSASMSCSCGQRACASRRPAMCSARRRSPSRPAGWTSGPTR